MSATTETIAEIDLEGCPYGTVLDPNEPDQRIEERYFNGWTNGLTAPARWKMPSCFRVVPDGDRPVLEHVNKTDRTLVAGQELWADYTVEARIRQLNAHTQPSNDSPHAIVARSGLMLRYRDLRQYYFLCMEGFDRLVLYHRRDEAWSELASLSNGLDRAHYYHLKAVCEGERISCFVDGEHLFTAYDDRLPTGKAGVRTDTRSRMHSVRIAASESERAAFVSRLSARERELAAEAEAYPLPVLGKRIDIGEFWPCQVRYGDFRGASCKEVILEKNTDEGPRVVCLDFDGNVQFDQTYPRAAGLTRCVMHDLDADGCEDFIGIEDDCIRVISGSTGELAAETPLPVTGPYRGFRDISMGGWLHSLRVLWPCHIRNTEHPQDLLLRDGDGAGTGYSLWAYDENLELRWRRDAHVAWHGMYLWFYDIDGDGRDEILPGYELYDGDGERLWVMEGAEYIEDSGGAGHIDHASFGELDGDESNGPEIGIAGSDPGFFLVDAMTGAVICQHSYGHVQGIYAGNFRPDLPGLEMWMGDRWGTYGILNLVSGRGEPLARCEPDNVSQGGPAVNWGGDGRELLFVGTSAKSFGLYDAEARKVVKPVCEGVPIEWGGGIVEDVIGDARDEITYVHEGAIYIVTQDRPYPTGERIYSPTRRMDISIPGWQTNE